MSLDLIAQYYDLIHNNFNDDGPMWETLARQANGPILEIGCGTGRLLLPLAQQGHTLAGIDLSAVALRAAQTKIKSAGLSERITLHRADMRHFDLPQKDFALALLALNTFMHCLTLDEQLATLQAIYGHLRATAPGAPAGQLIIDLFYPDPTLLAEADGRLYFEDETINELTGHTVQWYWRHEIDLEHQLRHLVYILDELDEAGVVRRAQIPFSLRFVYRYEMELLLQASGFALETIYGNYQLEPFHGHSPRMIFVARKV
ncbi:MAG: class I SAM-dependent methyltransferase [Anaerolineae bacterium]|nr:class I SAM-dependent methyltransferase [Anaerolineae bacterium]